MGSEALCDAKWGTRTSHGKALLETDYILFRGDFRLKVPFADLTGVQADNGTLVLRFKGGPASLNLGSAAEKWAAKILRPPSRFQKLGIKSGVKVALAGRFDPAFTGELSGHLNSAQAAGRGAKQKRNSADLAATSESLVREQLNSLESSDLVFVAMESVADLGALPELVRTLPRAAALWIIYPKGVSAIRETDVIGAGRAAGLTDIKVVSFSATHTGLKFVKPKSARVGA